MAYFTSEQPSGWSTLSPWTVKQALRRVQAKSFPQVANPPECEKRASVALILRFRPRHGNGTRFEPSRIPSVQSSIRHLDAFFEQDWVRRGIPEILFIKRAARASDRWGGHVAFPGGKREQTDLDDRAASIRETKEEVGLDLAEESCLYIGNLPERLVTASWGKKPLMVLCPFVYLMLRYDTSPLDPQPSEVHSIHWAPLHSILDVRLRSSQTTHVSDPIVPVQNALFKSMLRAMVGELVFSAVRILPSESMFSYSGDADGITAGKRLDPGTTMRITRPAAQPLLLWGLTLGIVADFLDLIEPNATAKLWSWPTFSHWDLQLACWLCTRNFRNAKAYHTTKTSDGVQQNQHFRDVDATTYTTKSIPGLTSKDLSIAGGHMLDAYFERMKQVLLLTVGTRLAIGIVTLTAIAAKLRRRR